jgi:hypothetical protein
LPRAFGNPLQLSDKLGVYRIVSGAERIQRRLARLEQDAEHRFELFVFGSEPALIPPGQRSETASACRFPSPDRWIGGPEKVRARFSAGTALPLAPKASPADGTRAAAN